MMPNIASLLSSTMICVPITVSLQDLGLTTVWDDQLSYLLTPALSAYEMERITGKFISISITTYMPRFNDNVG